MIFLLQLFTFLISELFDIQTIFASEYGVSFIVLPRTWKMSPFLTYLTTNPAFIEFSILCMSAIQAFCINIIIIICGKFYHLFLVLIRSWFNWFFFKQFPFYLRFIIFCFWFQLIFVWRWRKNNCFSSV